MPTWKQLATEAKKKNLFNVAKLDAATEQGTEGDERGMGGIGRDTERDLLLLLLSFPF